LFAVSKVSRKSQKPTQNEWINVIKIIKYLKGTKNYGLKFTNNPLIKTFADADFAGDKESRRSTSGYIITIGNTPIIGTRSYKTVYLLQQQSPNITASANVPNNVYGIKIF